MERGLRAKTAIIDDFTLPEELDLKQFKGIAEDEILEYLAIIYKYVPNDIRAEILKKLLNATLKEVLNVQNN